MTDETWTSPDVRCLGVRLNGEAIDELDERGERVVGATLVILINGGTEPIPFVLPATAQTERWEGLMDTADPWQPAQQLRGLERYHLQGRSIAVLQLDGHKRDARDWGPMGVY
jgi:isoamylase